MIRKRYAIAGASQRACSMFAVPITTQYADTSDLVGMFDPSQVHMGYINRKLPRPAPTFTDFDAMLEKTAPDTVIVATKDCVHHEYILRALQAGKDVITEKPMTIDAEKCRAILAAERQSGRTVTVTFNYRFQPGTTAIRRLIAEGAIGKVVTVDLHWPLNLDHGADYFRRWHRKRANSGGLQVHKATHHFDLINWFLQDEPASVAAQGALSFYGRNGPFRSTRCRGCPHKDRCPFYFDLNEGELMRDFYAAAEAETGYLRDGCVFDEEIDIEDNFSVQVRYKNGARLSYSLQAWAPWEGFRLEVQGDRGRLEYMETHFKPNWEVPHEGQVVVMANDGSRTVHTPPKAAGLHGGGDPALQRMLFTGAANTPLNHMAGSGDAVRSILVGVAATRSMHSGGTWIRLEDLLTGG